MTGRQTRNTHRNSGSCETDIYFLFHFGNGSGSKADLLSADEGFHWSANLLACKESRPFEFQGVHAQRRRADEQMNERIGRTAAQWISLALCIGVLSMGTVAIAQTDRDAIERVEQERARRQQREASAMAPLAAQQADRQRAAEVWLPPIADESPCFTVHRAVWADPKLASLWRFGGLLAKLPGYEGACLGTQSLERLRRNLDARLVAMGYVTSRVTIPAQNLVEGLLRVELQLGRVGRVVQRKSNGQVQDASLAWLGVQAGDVLNLRDIEQGMENAARLPSLAAQLAIEPGDAPGLSNIVLVHPGAPVWRARLSVDDQAVVDFGRWQAAASATVDLAWLGADQISLWHQRSARGWNPAQLQQRSSISYSTAWGAQLLSVNASQGQHRRVVQGTTLSFGERAQDHSVQLQLQRVLMRTADWRLSANLSGAGRQARTFIEDTELLLQRRRSREWEWGLEWQRRTADSTVSLRAQRQRTLVNDPRIDVLPDALPLPQQDSLGLSWTAPLAIAGIPAQYDLQLQAQWSRDPAFGADLRALGGGSVRGFEPSRQVVGLRSTSFRQDLLLAPPALQSPSIRTFIVLGLDAGQVGGLEDRPARERRLVGAGASLRLQTPQGLTAELNWARPVRQPTDWGRRSAVTSIQLASSF